MGLGFYNALISSVAAVFMLVSGIAHRSKLFFAAGLSILIYYSERLFDLKYEPWSTYVHDLSAIGLVVCALAMLWTRAYESKD